MKTYQSVLRIFPEPLREKVSKVFEEKKSDLEEIRLRANKPIAIVTHTMEAFLGDHVSTTFDELEAYHISMEEVGAVLNLICHNSIYAYEDELKQGFITILGGHRIGITGQVVLNLDGQIRTLKNVSGMNIRIAHEVKGVAKEVLPFLYCDGYFLNTLIISPPGCGKTTLLRDVIRMVSDGNSYGKGVTVGVVDERSEIAGSYMGAAQNDVGIRTDILDACPKVYGMMMLIRSMAPKVIAIDELDEREDGKALLKVSACGCKIAATIHGAGLEDILGKKYLEQLWQEKLFERYIILDRKDGYPRISGVYEKEMQPCYVC